MRSLTTIKVKTPAKASANNNFQRNGSDVNIQSLPAVSPFSHTSNNVKPIQMLRPLTTHYGLDESTLAGGGRDSNVNTGTEVRAIERLGTQQEIHAAIKCLKTSYTARQKIIENYFNTEEKRKSPEGQRHAQRIINEQNWEAQLEQALSTRFVTSVGGGGASSLSSVVIQQPPPGPRPSRP